MWSHSSIYLVIFQKTGKQVIQNNEVKVVNWETVKVCYMHLELDDLKLPTIRGNMYGVLQHFFYQIGL